MTDYTNARAWLAFLIDHPDKSVTVAEYRAMLAQAAQDQQRAHNTMMEAWG